MIHPIFIRIIFIALVSLIFIGCKKEQKSIKVSTDSFPIYILKDSITDDGTYRQMQYTDRIIPIATEKTVLEKLIIISDTLSKHYFNGLQIEIKASKPEDTNLSTIQINLIENPEFKGPATLPAYQSWYDYFQGAYGGQNTTVILKESFLQREYKGKWIDQIEFFYQGKPIGDWDHIDLSGIIQR